MRLTIQDKMSFNVAGAGTSRVYTDEGFLKVPGRVAKTGTQQYLRRELGLDGNPNDLVTVYRPPEEVFKQESLDGFKLADITYIHPKELVNSKNYKAATVGVVDGSGRQDGDFVVCDLLIKDADAIKNVESGISQLSAGYTAEYVPEKGVTADGIPYDFVQRDIKINHVAIVPVARAGQQARIFDNEPKGINMYKVTLDGGRTVEFDDEARALLVTDSIERLQKAVKDGEAKLQASQATIDAQKEKIDKLEKEDGETDDKIKEAVEKVSKTKDSAILVAGDKFTCDSVDVTEIQRSALAIVRPNIKWSDKDANYVSAAFDMAIEDAKSKPATVVNDQLTKLAADGAKQFAQVNDAAVSGDAYSKYKAEMSKSTRNGGQ